MVRNEKPRNVRKTNTHEYDPYWRLEYMMKLDARYYRWEKFCDILKIIGKYLIVFGVFALLGVLTALPDVIFAADISLDYFDYVPSERVILDATAEANFIDEMMLGTYVYPVDEYTTVVEPEPIAVEEPETVTIVTNKSSEDINWWNLALPSNMTKEELKLVGDRVIEKYNHQYKSALYNICDIFKLAEDIGGNAIWYMAVAFHESGYGTSYAATVKNNYNGVMSNGSTRWYKSPEDAMDHLGTFFTKYYIKNSDGTLKTDYSCAQAAVKYCGMNTYNQSIWCGRIETITEVIKAEYELYLLGK